MARKHEFKLKEQISEDSSGAVYRAYDKRSDKKVALRKCVNVSGTDTLQASEEVAYQVAIERLATIRHASLRRIVSGGIDPEDHTPYIATKWIQADPLDSILRETYLSVEVATTLLLQLLEVCDVLSHVLGEDGVWVETDAPSIGVTGDAYSMRFIFWPSPLKLFGGDQQPRDLSAIVRLTRGIMGWDNGEVDETRGGHLITWLNWVEESAGKHSASIREAREMLCAAAGIEPPEPVENLVAEAKRRLNWLEKLPTIKFKWIRRPKMPLFAGLSLLFVVEAVAGLWWIKKINEEVENELMEINLSILDAPYTLPEEEVDEDNPPPVSPLILPE